MQHVLSAVQAALRPLSSATPLLDPAGSRVWDAWLQADGPMHWSSNPPHRALGPAMARNRMLAAEGYQACPLFVM